MKTLLLIRHASSGWDDMTGSDRFRPLDMKGERELARMAGRCADGRARPDLIVSSQAVRALATARAMAEVLGYRADGIRVDDRLYAGSAQGLMNIITGLDDSLDQVAIVGHNPELFSKVDGSMYMPAWSPSPISRKEMTRWYISMQMLFDPFLSLAEISPTDWNNRASRDLIAMVSFKRNINEDGR